MKLTLDLVELVVVAAFAGLVLWSGWTIHRLEDATLGPSGSELEFYRGRYGPEHFSEHAEEWMIRDYFQDRRGGVFLDVGANHYRHGSNTYYLESKLGWSGLAVEPQRQFAEDYIKYRPATKFVPFFASDASNHTARLYVLKKQSAVASSDPSFVRQFGEPDEVQDVPTITLNDLLSSAGVRRIDFMSMDIEQHEPQALKGLDIERFRPAFVCIEALPAVRQDILDYFAQHRYVAVGKYLRADAQNLYFVPLESH